MKRKSPTRHKVVSKSGKVFYRGRGAALSKTAVRHYHVSDTNLGKEITLDPKGYYEAVGEDNNPLMYYGEFEESEIPELSASKTIAGALQGKYSTTRSAGTYYVYSITQKPDVDISHWRAGDFPTLKEVRYRKPVKAKLFKVVKIGKSQITKFDKEYEDYED